jgi:glycosyltransferase involved in cell wall biosynthesis
VKRTLSVLLVHLGDRDGGAERQTAALGAGLARRGHRVLALVRRDSPLERRALEAGAPIFPLGPRFPMGPGGIFTWWSRQRARDLALRGGWDLIHFADPVTFNVSSGLLASAAPNGSRRKPRILVSYRGSRGGGSARSVGALRRHHRAGGTVHVDSEALWSALVREGFDEDRLAVIHPGIDIKGFAAKREARSELRRELGVKEEDELIGTVGILDRDRGIGDLMAAVSKLVEERPGARLVVVGDGPERAGLEARACRSGPADRFLFTGWSEDVSGILKALDLYVFSGVGEEVFPLSLVEAMAGGIPVVARDQPGIREIIDNGKQGLFVPGNSPEEIARTMFRALADRDQSRRMGRAGAVRVQRFHTQAMIDGTEALYFKLVGSPEES